MNCSSEPGVIAAGAGALPGARRRYEAGTRTYGRAMRTCLALLAATALLAMAAPAQAQTEVWSATLTPVNIGGSGILGCLDVPFAQCSITAILSDDDFTHDSTDYTVFGLILETDGSFSFAVDTIITTETAALTLVVGSTSLVLADATTTNNLDRTWASSGVSLTAGTAITVKLTAAAPTNTPATGAPTITGTAQVGQTLTASTTGIADADGLTSVSYAYQWIRVNGTEADIAAANSSTYILVDADLGTTLKVRVTFADDASNSETLTSAATATVGAAATGPPTVTDVAVTSTPASGTTYYLAGEVIEFTVTFSAPVTVTATPKFAFRLGAATRQAAYASGSDSAALVFARTVQAGEVDSNGISWNALALALDGGTITQTGATTAAILTHAEQASLEGHRVDAAPPMQVSASVRGLSLVLVYDEPLDPASMPATGAYTVTATVGATTTNPAVSEVSIYGIWVTLALDAAPAAGATVTLAYAPPASNPVQDEAGNDAPAFSGQSVRLGPPPPDLEQVLGVSVTPGNAQLVVTWTAVSTATGYTVQWKSSGQGYNTGDRQATVTSGTTTSHTITGLANGTEYTVQVSATRTGANDGPPSDEMTGTPFTTPPPPPVTDLEQVLGVSVTPGNAQLVVTWTAVDNATGYTVQWKSGGQGYNTGDRQATVTTGSTTSHTITGLANGTEYTVQVSATRTGANDGPPSDEMTGTPFTTPPPPPPVTDLAQVTGVGVAPGNAQLVVTWTAVDNATGYTVQWKSSGQGYNTGDRQATVTSGSTTRYTIPSLANGTEYTVRVIATRTGADDGPPSEEETGTPRVPNTAATGAPTITGTAQVGETLTASTTGIADANGLTSPTYTYQWIRVDGTEADIAGENSSTYTLVDADLGKTLKVKVTFADDLGHTETLTSAATATVGAAATGPTVNDVAVTSTPASGNTYYLAGEVIEFTVTFSAPVTVTATPKFAFRLGAATRQAAYASGSDSAALVFARTVQAGEVDRNGISWNSLALALDGGTITQTGATTAARLTHAAQASLEGHRVDAAPPMQVSASVRGLSLVLVYDEPLDPASMPTTAAYTVTATVGATTTNPAVSEVSIYGIWVTLALDAAPAAGATVTLAYAPPASNPVQDEAGNDAPAFSGQSVRLGPPPPPPDLAQVMGVTVAPGNAQLVVTWTAVDNATSYTVQWTSGSQGYNTGDRQATVTSGSTTSHTITGLANGTEYTVQVSATRTGANDGPPSDEMTGTPTVPTAAGIAVSTAALTVTEQDSTGDGYTVVLDTEPTADVVVTVAGHVGTDVTANPTTLTFTMSNWETAQTVTVTADNDADTTDDSVALTHSAASADSGYSGIAIAGVAVTVNDNDTAQVMGVGVAPGNAQLVVTWTAVDTATGYTVQWKSGSQAYNSGDRQATVTTGSTTSHTITGLANGTEYTVQVSATRTGANDGPPSDEMTGTPYTTPPPPPPPVTDLAQVMGVTVAPGNAQLVVTWTAVSTATGYTVQWKSGGQGYNTTNRQATVTSGTTTSHTITGLANGTEYTVQVSATRTGANDGPPSDEMTGTPTVPTAAGIAVSTAALTVTEQDSTGDGYTVVLDTEPTADVVVTVAGHVGTDVTANPTALTFTMSNWDTAQTVTVTADNDTDTTDDSVTLTHSAASADSGYSGIAIAGVAVTVNDNDTAQVTGVGVAPGNAQLVVTWTAVDTATGYTVQWKSGSQAYNTTNRQATVTSGSTTSHTITGLANGTEYTVQVSATRTGANDGPPSAEVTASPFTTPPPPPVTDLAQVMGVTVAPGNAQLVVTWTAVDNATGYTVQWKSGSQAYNSGDRQATVTSGSTTRYTIPSLTNGTPYTVRVIATRTGANDGPSSSEVMGTPFTTPPPPPPPDLEQVLGVGVVPGNAQLVVTWTAVDTATGYTVQWTSGSQAYNTGDRQATVTSGSTTRYTIPSLANGTPYTVRVIATRTSANDGPPSSEVTASPFTTPGAPQHLSAVAGDAQVTLTWDAPSSDGGSAILRYEVAVDDSGTWIDAGLDLEETVTGLTNGQRYTFAVRAVNAAGTGPAATVTIVTSNPLPQAWLARFGRAATDHVVDAVSSRWQGGPQASHLTIGGVQTGALFGWIGRVGQAARDTADDRGDPVRTEASWAQLFAPSGGAGTGGGGTGPGMTVTDRNTGQAGLGGVDRKAGATLSGRAAQGALLGALGLPDPRALTDLRAALLGSSFFYSGAGDEDGQPRTPGRFGEWSAWGRGAASWFSGTDSGLSLDGEVVTAMLGLDSRWDRWLAGVVVSHSRGQGTYAHPTATGGAVASSLTALHPYAGYKFNERTSIWGVLGYGVGEMSLTPERSVTALETGLMNAMAAVGGRMALSVRSGPARRFELAIRSDARLTNTAADGVGAMAGAAGQTHRVRMMLEGSGVMPLASGGVLKPRLEAGLRYDAGDAETGAGLEVGGGLGYAFGRLSLEVNARGLLAHRDTQYEEWGFSGAVAYTPSEDGRGVSLRLGSGWGATQSGVQSLWRRQDASDLVRHAEFDAAQRYQVELRYGFDGLKGRVRWTPYIGVDSVGGSSQALRLGVTLTSGRRFDAGLELGRRQGGPGAGPEHAGQIRVTLLW